MIAAMGIESPQLVDSNGDVILDMYEVPNGCEQIIFDHFYIYSSYITLRRFI